MADNIIYTDEANFEKDVLNVEGFVVLDFYSEDCPPCEQLAPIYERLEEKYGQHMKFVKIFRQGNREVAKKMNATGSPTVIFFENGKEVGNRLSGFIKKPELRKEIEKIIGEDSLAKELEQIHCDLLIMGGGTAGLSAGIYAGRAKTDTIILEESVVGGQVSNTYHIANYPGTGDVIRGRDLMKNMRKQAEGFGCRIHDLKEIFDVKLAGPEKYVKTEDAEYYAKAVVLATGAEPRKLPAKNEENLRGRGVHYCATCDGAMYEDAKVIVLGGGNAAVEEAVFLTRYASEVVIVHQFDHFQASQGAQQEAFDSDKIKIIWDSEIREVHGEDHLTGVEIENVKTGETSEIEADGVFVYIGTVPNYKHFEGQVDLNQWNYVKADENMKTSVPGVFVAGDIRDKLYRQAVMAAADGAIAGIEAEKFIGQQKAEKKK